MTDQRSGRKAKTISELIEEIKSGLGMRTLPVPPKGAPTPPKPKTEAAEREIGEEG